MWKLVRPAGARVHTALITGAVRAARPVGYKGIRRAAVAVSRVFGDHQVVVRLRSGARMNLSLGDGYWIGLLSPSFAYEPELETALATLLQPNAYFIDCGANIGYWSLMHCATARAVVAVEANPSTFGRLEENLKLNNADVTAINAAVWCEDGHTMRLHVHDARHAASTLRNDVDKSAVDGWSEAEVLTVTLDSVIRDHCPDLDAPVIIKLDVEGAEIEAINGASECLRTRDVTLLYEDHMSDPTHAVSRHVLALGMEILDPQTEEQLTLGRIDAIKTRPGKGYNFLARHPKTPT